MLPFSMEALLLNEPRNIQGTTLCGYLQCLKGGVYGYGHDFRLEGSD
jgi:hypothetical protein